MIIQVLSQKEAIELAGRACPATSIISITSREAPDVSFPENADIVSVFPMKFNDLTREYDDEGIPYGRPLPQREDFAGLRAFVAGLTCDLLIVHCWEGRSRSAAVAAAIYEARGKKDELRVKPGSLPNPLVYELARRELGLSV